MNALDADAPRLPLADQRALPELGVQPDWKNHGRLWGHAFHPMCSYLGSFPAPLAHAFISRFSRPGDVVLDPFSGRGTVPLQAVVERRIGAGNDASPLAHLLTAAKVDAPPQLEVEERLAQLRLAWFDRSIDWLVAVQAGAGAITEGPAGRLDVLRADVLAAFHPRSLAQLLFLRRCLDVRSRTDRFLAAAALGILHGRSRGYLSDAMPNGFSLAPGYAARWVAARQRAVPERDVLRLLAAKVRRLYRDGRPPTGGVALLGDARDAGSRLRSALATRGQPERARLVITSPPYLRTLRYGSLNWLRLWFLGLEPAAVDTALQLRPGPLAFGEFLRETLTNLRPALSHDAIVVMVVGDLATDLGKPRTGQRDLAASVWEAAAEPAGYRLAGAIRDPVAANRKLTRLWGAQAGRATDTDRILILGATELGRRRALAALDTPVDWSWPLSRSAGLQPILGRDAADVPPGRPGLDGPARPDEESRPRAHDLTATQLRAPAAGSPVRP